MMLVTSRTGAGRGCPICGHPHATCGPTGTGTPVDIPVNDRKGQGMARTERVATERRWINYNGQWRLFKISSDDPRYAESAPYDADADDSGRPDAILTGADVREGKSVKDKQAELAELEQQAADRREQAESDREVDEGRVSNKARSTGGRTARRATGSGTSDSDK